MHALDPLRAAVPPGSPDPVDLLLQPFHHAAARSRAVVVGEAGRFSHQGRSQILPRFILSGPGGDAPIRLGFFGGLHGDEPESVLGLLPFFQDLVAEPERARGYLLYFYPLANPTGYRQGTRESASGKDLNREFWSNSPEPEVRILERELLAHQFHGLVATHADSDSPGTYGYVQGATLSAEILDPALAAAEAVLPRNREPVIDGWPAQDGIIRQGYPGILSSPRALPFPHRPFEIVFETPQQAPLAAQVEATRRALHSILENYRSFISYSADL